MPCNDYDNNPRNYEELQLGDDKLNAVTTFKYLGSIFHSNGGAERDINNRVRLAWMKWKQLTGVLCDKKVPIKLKDKVYKTVIKPTMTYGAECWAVRKKDENRLHVAEIDTEPPWAMLFADDIVLCETSKAAVERERTLEIWRDHFERHGLRVSRTKTAYMPCNDYDNNPRNYEELQLGDDKLNAVTTFKYLGSIFHSNGGAERDINNRVRLAWMK